ncbi:MAG: hypothetical protein KatS3mg111_1950 [Pirellulaceae bacterium]|nr:MAG: hypothetical protein KatS3mg111_1950 [Pirellulaceae bacterium]
MIQSKPPRRKRATGKTAVRDGANHMAIWCLIWLHAKIFATTAVATLAVNLLYKVAQRWGKP